MNKQELIEAIEATLVPNGNKAITADALRNLLIDIVENSGQGGGMTFQIGMEPDETGNGVVPTTTPEQIAHNKEQIDILKQLHDEGKPIPPIALEMSSTMEGMEASQMIMSLSYIMWNLTGTEVPEGMPEGLIFPVVQFIEEIIINGDGTLIML
jgi:hypothetical protein